MEFLMCIICVYVCRCLINGNKKWTSPISNRNQKVSIRNSDTYFWWPRFEAVTLCDHFYIPQYQLCRCICPGMSKRMSFSDEMEHVFLIIVNLYQCIDIVLFHSISVPFINCWPTVFRGPLSSVALATAGIRCHPKPFGAGESPHGKEVTCGGSGWMEVAGWT